jgi:hypothetical protein
MAGEYWLYVHADGVTERSYPDKPTDRPTLHIWVSGSGTEFTATYSVEDDDGVLLSIKPYGQGWKLLKKPPPSFVKLRTHQPSTVWGRRAVRS